MGIIKNIDSKLQSEISEFVKSLPKLYIIKKIVYEFIQQLNTNQILVKESDERNPNFLIISHTDGEDANKLYIINQINKKFNATVCLKNQYGDKFEINSKNSHIKHGFIIFENINNKVVPSRLHIDKPANSVVTPDFYNSQNKYRYFHFIKNYEVKIKFDNIGNFVIDCLYSCSWNPNENTITKCEDIKSRINFDELAEYYKINNRYGFILKDIVNSKKSKSFKLNLYYAEKHPIYDSYLELGAKFFDEKEDFINYIKSNIDELLK